MVRWPAAAALLPLLAGVGCTGKGSPPRPHSEPIPWQLESARPESRQVGLRYVEGVGPTCPTLDRIAVVEEQRRVVISVLVVAKKQGICAEGGIARHPTVELAQVLGTRALVDGATGTAPRTRAQ